MNPVRSDAGSKAVDEVWDGFRDALRHGLELLGDFEELTLEAPRRRSGAVSKFVLANGGFGTCHAMYMADDVSIAPVTLPMDNLVLPKHMPDAIVRMMREQAGLAHPQMLRARPGGPGSAAFAGRLGLELAPDLVDQRRRAQKCAERGELMWGGPDELREFVRRVTWQAHGQEWGFFFLEINREGELTYEVEYLGTTAFLEFDREGAFVKVSASVVRDVQKPRVAAVELDRLNREGDRHTWFMADGDVLVRTSLPARPLTADNLVQTLLAFNRDLRRAQEGLADRISGDLIAVREAEK